MKRSKMITAYVYGFMFLLAINLGILNKTLNNRRDQAVMQYKMKLDEVVKDIEIGILKKNIEINRISSDTGIFMRFLSGETELKSDVDRIVSLMRKTLQIDIVYLLDDEGTTLSSSVYNDKGDTLEGKNYNFREYFIGSMEGKQMVYAALGVTTYRHGIYVSCPVYNYPERREIRGVLVFKIGLAAIDKLMNELDDPAIFSTPHGMILSSNNKKWLFKSKQLLSIGSLEDKSNLDLERINNGKITFPLWVEGWTIEVFPKQTSFSLSLRDKGELAFIFTLPLILVSFIVFLHYQIKKRVELEQELEKYYLIVNQAPISILISDPNGVIEYVNPQLEKTTGYTNKELIGQKPNIFKTQVYNDEFYEELWKKLKNKEIWYGEFYNKKKSGENYWERSIIAPLLNKKNEIENFIAIKEDITENKELEEKLKYQAAVDEMTKVFNKRSGLLFLEKQLQLTKRQGTDSLSVCYVDINDLKKVNDTLGHTEGDNLILLIIQVIKEQIRSSDIISRFGGDEFLIIFPNCDGFSCRNLMKRICRKLDEINCSKRLPYQLSMSFGVSEFEPENEINMDKLISSADEKMYRMKRKVKAMKMRDVNEEKIL